MIIKIIIKKNLLKFLCMYQGKYEIQKLDNLYNKLKTKYTTLPEELILKKLGVQLPKDIRASMKTQNLKVEVRKTIHSRPVVIKINSTKGYIEFKRNI